MNRRFDKIIYWMPRVLSILFILFLTMFSLDVFDGDYGFFGTILGLLIHNIPSFVLLGILIISWKYEIVGGVAYILAGMAFIVLRLAPENADPWYMILLTSLIISGPAILIGILFLIGWFGKKD
jgi:hypothetical protein